MSIEIDHITRFFKSLAYLNFPDCKKLAFSSNSGIYEQLAYEGYGQKDYVTQAFMKLLQDIYEFDLKYYSFAYFDEKDIMSGNF